MKNPSQQWRVLVMEVVEAEAERAVAVLGDYEIGGIEQRDGAGGTTILYAYFAPNVHTFEDAVDALKTAFPHCMIRGEEIIWNPHDEAWRQHFRPFPIVPGVIIAPSWERYCPAPGEQLIMLDPGMAFGTGLHATTRMCARVIADLCRSTDTHRSLLDVGCGSGILSLVARRLGIADITAVENDDEAAVIARKNFERNGVSDITVAPHIGTVTARYDLVVANILYATLMEMRDDLMRVTGDCGLLVLSGVTAEQTDDVIHAYSTAMKHRETIADDEWRCIIFGR